MRDRKNWLADLEISDAGANRVDDARHLSAGRERKRRLDLILALDLQNVEEVQTRCLIADSHLAGTRLGNRDIFQRHRLRLAPSVYAPGFHGRSVRPPNLWLS